MPDWNTEISGRIGKLNLAQEARSEVVTELASHLDDLYQEFSVRGATEPEAIELALNQVADWRKFGQEISDTKNEEARMNDRTKQFWLPGFAVLTASMLWLMILQRGNWHWESTSFHGSPPLMPYVIWLITQPVFGAAGAYLSRRAGGSRLARLAAGIFPPIATSALLVFIALTAVFVEQNPFVLKHPAYFALIVFPWVVFPALALFLGVFPFLKITKPKLV